MLQCFKLLVATVQTLVMQLENIWLDHSLIKAKNIKEGCEWKHVLKKKKSGNKYVNTSDTDCKSLRALTWVVSLVSQNIIDTTNKHKSLQTFHYSMYKNKYVQKFEPKEYAKLENGKDYKLLWLDKSNMCHKNVTEKTL